MRKSRFLLNLIAATAIGLSVFGCDSADSGSIGDTTDIIAANNNNGSVQALREYLVIGQRGLDSAPITLNVQAPQQVPTNTPGEVIAGGTGDADVDRAQLFEIFGINNVPQPGFNLLQPGGTSNNPNVPETGDATGNSGTSGYHGVYVDPTGKFMIGVSRAKNQGTAFDASNDITNAQVQIFAFEIEESLEDVFPPNVVFGTVFDPTPIQVFPPNQGLFVSGAWSNDAKNFYLGMADNFSGEAVRVYSIDGNFGRLTGEQVVPFQAGPNGFNNPMKILIPPSDAFVYAVDNANNQITRYSRNPADGTLTLLGQTPTVADARGATIDRTGTYMYVVGRASGLLAGYRIEAEGDLTPIEVFDGFGPIAFPFGFPLGDIDANPQNDTIFMGSYLGALGGYSIDMATGQLTAGGNSGFLLSGSRNMTNVEVDPTGRFVVTAQEADFEELQPYVTAANGFQFPENNVFANLTPPNDSAANFFSPTAQQDSNGNTVFILPQQAANAFMGDVQHFRISADNSVRAEGAVDSINPYGLDFLQLVITPPAPASVNDGGDPGDGTGDATP